jgi:hypothetical protein
MRVCTLPIKADEPPSLEMPTATLAGAPPGTFLKAGASASVLGWGDECPPKMFKNILKVELFYEFVPPK